MQQQLINLNSDLNQLEAGGYDIAIYGGYLVIRHIPYVTPGKKIDYGILICAITLVSPTKVSPPQDHTIHFNGETPCDSNGMPLISIINNNQRQQLTPELLSTHFFSSKPMSGNYPNYFEKVRTYAEILSIHAKMIDNTVTTKPNKKNEYCNIN